MNRLHAPLLLISCSFFPASSTFGQGLLHRFDGVVDGDLAGFAVADAGDLDHDGFPDFIVGAKVGKDPGGAATGYAKVYSGIDESVLFAFYGQQSTDFFGHSVSTAGDVDGDGTPDFVVGAPQENSGGHNDNGSARVYSGADGTVLFTFVGDHGNIDYGYSVRDAGDVDNDGWPDVVVGAWRDHPNGGINEGSASVYSGQTGQRLYYFQGDAAGDELGFSVSGAGDTNADGYDDVIVATLDIDDIVLDGGGARLFSGQDGSILAQFYGDSTADWYGYAVTGLGDLDADGYDDVLVGAPRDDNNGDDSGMIRVFSGQTHAMMFQVDGTIKSRFGWSVADADDVNGDSIPDLIVGAPWEASQSGRVHVLSGADGQTLHTLEGPNYSNFGFFVSSARDANRDTVPDVIVGAPFDDTYGDNMGSAHVISVACGSSTPFGAGCAGSGGFVPTLDVTGCRTPGGNITLEIDQALGGTFAVLFLGAGHDDLAYGGACPLNIAPLYTPVLPLMLGGAGDGNGSISLSTTVPKEILAPVTLNLQALVADPSAAGGAAQTNALELVIG